MNLRAALVLINLLAGGVPRRWREDWQREWHAELRAHAAERGAAARPLHYAKAALADAISLRARAARSPQQHHDIPRDSVMFGLTNDLRFAARALLKSPGFTLAVVAVLAVGIAANTAVFTFADAMLWRALPAEEPEELVRIYTGYAHGFQWGSSSYPVFEELASMDVLDGLIGEAYRPMGFELDGSAHRIWGALVTPGYFEFLSVAPLHGRFFTASESAVRGLAPWVVLSERFWRRHLGGDPAAIGDRLDINGFPFTVIGVVPGSFLGTQTGIGPELWIPMSMQSDVISGPDWTESRRVRELWLTGRRAPGVTVESARAAMAARAESLKTRFPNEYESLAGLNVIPEIEGGFHPFYRAPFAQFLGLLMVVVGVVLVVASSNAAGMLIARGATRGREVAIRRAVGAASWRVTRQLFVENLLLAMIAGAVGIVVSIVVVRLVGSLKPPTDIPLTFDFAMNAKILGFSVVVSMLTAALFGLLPALQTTRGELAYALRSRDDDGSSGSRIRGAIVIGQVALSMTLLVGAGLFLRSLGNATRVALGFEPAGIQLGSLDLAPRGYDADVGRELFRQLQDRLDKDPDIVAAALGSRQPFGLDPAPARVVPEGFIAGTDGAVPTAEFNAVSPSFLTTIGTRFLHGRNFADSDDSSTQPVVIVSKRFAEDFWPDRPAIGRQVQIFERGWEVVGVVEDTKFRTLSGEVLPYFYVPLSQYFTNEVTVFARPQTGAELESVLRRHVAALDASVPVFGLKSLNEQVGVALLPARMGAALLSVFGALTLGLAAIGLYGVLAYSVERRRREIGIRIALGARQEEVLAGVVRDGVRLAGFGLALGLVSGFVLSRLLGGLLHGVSTSDPASYLVTAACLGTVAVLASWLPAMRAASVDPAVILRDD